MKNCIIIEDQLPAQRILKKYIENIRTLNLVATFSDALQAMQLLNNQSIDLIFLDIHLPKLSGIDFLKSIPHPPKIILTTAFPDYALESYELDVVDYLLKPFSFQRFIKAVNKLSDKDGTTNFPLADYEPTHFEIFIKSGYEHIRIDIRQITHINADSDYTDVHLKNKKYISSEPLKYWENMLALFNFIRVHKSFIVNLDHVKKIVGNQIYMTSNIKVPIGRTYKKLIVERFIN